MRVSLALLAVSLRSVVAQDSCPAMQPICTSAYYGQTHAAIYAAVGWSIFDATVAAAVNTTSEVGPNYGCLNVQPSPAWYYLEIDQPGQIDILMSMADAAGYGKDIDFAMWGPFDSLSASQSACGAGLGAPVSCSSSSTFTETAVVPSTATTGQFYVLLLINFANVPAQITLRADNLPGTIKCSAPPSPPTAPHLICNDDCMYAIDGECDDGGSGSVFFGGSGSDCTGDQYCARGFHLCDRGSDCTDCGDRVGLPSRPPSPPPPADEPCFRGRQRSSHSWGGDPGRTT